MAHKDSYSAISLLLNCGGKGLYPVTWSTFCAFCTLIEGPETCSNFGWNGKVFFVLFFTVEFSFKDKLQQKKTTVIYAADYNSQKCKLQMVFISTMCREENVFMCTFKCVHTLLWKQASFLLYNENKAGKEQGIPRTCITVDEFP